MNRIKKTIIEPGVPVQKRRLQDDRRVSLHHPRLEDLKYTKQLWEDAETMSFNQKWGGTVAFPKEQWNSFYERYCSNNPHYIYFHIHNENDQFVGEVSAKSEDLKEFSLNIKILASKRGHQYGCLALKRFLNVLFLERNAERIIDDVASDNLGAIGLLLKCGFTISLKTDEITYMTLDKTNFRGK